MAALRRAGTTVYEPCTASGWRSRPTRSAPVLPVLARLRARAATPARRGAACVLDGEIPAARVHELRAAAARR